MKASRTLSHSAGVARPNICDTRLLEPMAGRPNRKLRLVEPGQAPVDDARPAQEAQAAPVPSAVASALAPSGPLDDLPDAQLVALGCGGDTRALERLYRRHAAFAIAPRRAD